MVGNVPVGGNNPISVQSMTNTVTTDVKGTINQIQLLENAGADIVRVSCPDQDSTKALKLIVKEVKSPIVADIHFHYKRAIEAAKMGASCLRINPGNIGSKERILEVVKAAKDYDCSIRIGVNAGSLDKLLLEKYKEPCPEALVESASYNIKLLEDNDFFNFKISVKSSDIFLTVKAYKKLAEICDYPLHLGVTEAGGLLTGSIKSLRTDVVIFWFLFSKTLIAISNPFSNLCFSNADTNNIGTSVKGAIFSLICSSVLFAVSVVLLTKSHLLTKITTPFLFLSAI